MRKKIVVLQSNYIPWKGYFDLMNYADEFVIQDTAQYTRRDWRNRNKIKTPRGVVWLTIPVVHRSGQLIQETQISDPHWARKHWGSILQNYKRAPYFGDYKETFESIYSEVACEPLLSVVNFRLISEICKILGIHTRLSWSRDYSLAEDKTERHVNLCTQLDADEYISGPSARNYLDEVKFARAGIKLTYMDYSGYPEYNQLYPPFEHSVSVIDLIFNEGPNATKLMKSFAGCAPEEPWNAAPSAIPRIHESAIACQRDR
jgi:hypothetical protein